MGDGTGQGDPLTPDLTAIRRELMDALMVARALEELERLLRTPQAESAILCPVRRGKRLTAGRV